MTLTRNLAVFLLILHVVIAPALGVDGDLPEQLQELEVDVARQAMKLIELEHLCEELAAKISSATGDEDVLNSLTSVSDRLEGVSLALQGLETRIGGTSYAESEGRLSGIRRDIELLQAQNAVLSERIQVLREAASPTSSGPSAGESWETSPNPVSHALSRVAYGLLVLSQEMRGSFLDVASVIGGGLGTLARLSDARGPELSVLPGPGLVVAAFVLLLAIAVTSMMIQGYYRAGFQSNFTTLSRLGGLGGLLHRSNAGQKEEDAAASIDAPFWDPAPRPGPGPAEGTDTISQVDEEYARMLLRLGYREEALRLVSPRDVKQAAARPGTISGEPGRLKQASAGRGVDGRLAPVRWLYKRAYNSFVIAGRRSMRYRMRASRRAGKQRI